MQPPGMLVFFHCGAHTGYAIDTLERTFLTVARNVAGSDARIALGYKHFDHGQPAAVLDGFEGSVLQFDPSSPTSHQVAGLVQCVRELRINIALGFDQPVRRPFYSHLRRAGVRAFVSYWGAPMSSLNHGLKLAAKRLDVGLSWHKPDHFVFESEAMRETAVRGRGVPYAVTTVCSLGVDTLRFRPNPIRTGYAHAAFHIPPDRRLVYYSGHFEERKGVAVIVRAAMELIETQGRRDVHFLLLGNKSREADRFAAMLNGRRTRNYVTFGGYRDDVASVLPECYVAAIASTGWDSFTVSALEAGACGVPLVASNLQGLAEAVDHEVTGFSFPAGDHIALARALAVLLDEPARRQQMSRASRARVEARFTREHQIRCLTDTIERVCAQRGLRTR